MGFWKRNKEKIATGTIIGLLVKILAGFLFLVFGGLVIHKFSPLQVDNIIPKVNSMDTTTAVLISILAMAIILPMSMIVSSIIMPYEPSARKTAQYIILGAYVMVIFEVPPFIRATIS